MEIAVRGDGIAACCCAQLLGSAGFPVATQSTGRSGVPAILVGARTQQLISDVFRRDDLFRGLPRVSARIVAWGADPQPRRVGHSAVVVSEQDLLERLQWRPVRSERMPEKSSMWTIFASRTLPASTVEHRFGSRVASVWAVDLAAQSENSVCWIESLTCGWLFLLPCSPGKGWLLAVGPAHDALLSESRLVAEQIQSVVAAAGQFPAYPAMADPFCGPQWLACGSGALAFDPLCGDGAGNAIREAILAAAVIRAAGRGEPEDQLLNHYRARLVSAFTRHLQLCRDFYAKGGTGPWWDEEIRLIHPGIEYCKREEGKAPPFRYRLEGYELLSLSSSGLGD